MIEMTEEEKVTAIDFIDAYTKMEDYYMSQLIIVTARALINPDL